MSYTRQENDNGLDAKSVEIAAPMRQHPAPVCQFSEAVQNIFGTSIIEDYHQMQDAMAEFKMFCWQTSPEKNEGPSEGSLWHLVGETKESLIILRDEMVIYTQHEQSNLIELQRAFEDFQTNIKLMEERLELSKAIENRAQTNMNIGSVVACGLASTCLGTPIGLLFGGWLRGSLAVSRYAVSDTQIKQHLQLESNVALGKKIIDAVQAGAPILAPRPVIKVY